MKIDRKIAFYVVKKGLYGYWQPTAAMRAAGFNPIRCGIDGPDAWKIAIEWNERWQQHRSNSGMSSAGGASKPGYVYFAFFDGRVKVGFSAKPLSRVNDLMTAMHGAPRMILALRGTRRHEALLHDRLKAHRTRGEWFAANALVTRYIMRCASFETLDDALRDSTFSEQTVGTVPTFQIERENSDQLSPVPFPRDG
jgi:hypothetical protein